MDRREIARIIAKAREDGATTLDLTGQGLGTLPPEIGNLTNLRSLVLSFNDLTVLPAEIGNLTNLVYLYLNHNQLWVLSPQIGKLSSLQYLNLRDNRLMGLPREIGNLTLLTDLDLRSNQLTELSPQLGTLIERGIVNVSGNPLTELPTGPTQEIQAHGQKPPSEQQADLQQTSTSTANANQSLHGWGSEGSGDSENNLNEKRVYAVVVLPHYAPGCDPLGVDDWCDEYWCPTYAEAIRAKAAVTINARNKGEGERGVAAVSVKIMDFGVGRQARRGDQVILENCRCPQHGGVTSEHEASDLDFLYKTGIGWVEAQEADNVRKDRVGLSGPSGPSVMRWMRAKQIYDEVFASESESGSSPEKSHVNAISSVNEMLVAGGVLEDYTDSIPPNSGDADKFYYRGVTFAESGDNRKAIENFTEAIRLQPDHAAAFYNRSLCHNSLGYSQMSYEDIREAIFLRPDYDFDTNTAVSSATETLVRPVPGIGDLVRHNFFGEGVVMECLAISGDHEVTVHFKGGVGIKRLLLNFAPLEII